MRQDGARTVWSDAQSAQETVPDQRPPQGGEFLLIEVNGRSRLVSQHTACDPICSWGCAAIAVIAGLILRVLFAKFQADDIGLGWPDDNAPGQWRRSHQGGDDRRQVSHFFCCVTQAGEGNNACHWLSPPSQIHSIYYHKPVGFLEREISGGQHLPALVFQ